MQCWIVPEGAASSADRVSARGGQRGSLLVASVLMMFFLLIIAGLAVDMSRYYLSKENVQNVADDAAIMAGARAHFAKQHGRHPLNCTVYSEGDLTISTNLRATGGSLCVSGDVQANNIDTNTNINRVALPEDNAFDRRLSGNAKPRYRYTNSNTVPSLKATYRHAASYTVDMTRRTYTASWNDGDDGPCMNDSNSGDDDRVMPNVEWEDGSAVCVYWNGSGFVLNNGGREGPILNASNPYQPVTIVSDRPVHIRGSVVLNGAVVSTRSITIDGNNHWFVGNPEVLGGLTLWSGTNLTVNASNSSFHGIVGADNTVSFGSTSNTAPMLRGQLIAGGDLRIQGRNVANVTNDSSQYQLSILNKTGDDSDWIARPTGH